MAQHFDVSLKLLFQRSGGIVAQRVFGGPVVEWVNVELPEVRNPRVDLLARDAQGRLHHLELESANTATLPRRIAEYHLALHRVLGEDVDMNVLYVGRDPLRMKGEFRSRSMDFRFDLLDMSEFDGAPLLASDDIGDNMLALLTECEKELVLRRVEEKLGAMALDLREETKQLFVLLSGLRDLEVTVARRLQMIDVMENKVFGPAILKGEVTILLDLLETRFGPLPDWVLNRLEGARQEQLLAWGRRVLTAASLEAVFE